MAINEFQPDEMTEQQMDDAVNSALASYGRSPRDFDHASQHYNSDFFKGESAEFKRRMCRALHHAFLPLVNTFWQKNAEDL